MNSDLGIEHLRHGGGSFTFTPEGESLVGVSLGDGIAVEQSRGGATQETFLVRGIVQVMPEGEPRTFRHRDDAHHAQIHLPILFLRTTAEAMGLPAHRVELIPQLSAPDATLLTLAELLLDAREEKPLLYRQSLGRALAAHVLVTYGVWRPAAVPTEQALAPRLLQRVAAYLRAQLGRDVSIDELADLVGLSPSHFATLFRRATGASPYRYLTRLRVERARELLLASSRPIAAIAAEVGFYDQSHLTRHMKRILGVAPGQLRRR
jgi:AraC family transcriptional regulator